MDIHATLSLFTIPSGETHVSTNWYFSNDSDFTTTIHESLADTINKTNYEVTIGGTGPIYVRAQVVTNMGSIAIADASVVALTSTPLPNINILGYPHSVATSPVINIGNFNSSVNGNTHVSTNWIIFNSQNDIVWSSLNNTVQLTTITIPNGVLVENTAYVLKVNYVGSIEDSPFSRLPLSVGIADGTLAPIIATPTLNVSGAPNAVPLTPALFGGAFSTIVGSDIHVSTDWIIETMNGSTVWSAIADTVNKTTITVPSSTLLNNVSYRFIVRYNGASVVSNYRTVTASTAPIVSVNAWHSTTPHITPITGHTQSTLNTGNVLIVGGWGSPAPINLSSIYNPTTDVWSSVATHPTGIDDHTQSTLIDGRVLVVGGWSAAGITDLTHIYNPTTNLWASAANYPIVIQNHSQSTLLDGSVLVVGGDGSANPTNLTNIYNPATNVWTSAANHPTGVDRHSQSTLLDGRVLVVGGYNTTGRTNLVHIYNPTTNLWSSAANYPTAVGHHSQSTLSDGRVLVVGGWGTTGTNLANIYDPVTDVWTSAANYPTAINLHAQSTLPDGRALVVGGWDTATNTNTANIYTP